VGDAVDQLDQVTQQNAALVEQSAAAADSLHQQATRLVQAVGRFRLAPA
jgi:methyl-accepting chemotaxis protein